MKNIVIFASGSGSNAENIILHFKKSAQANVAAVFSNKANAGVIERAETQNIPTVVFTKDELLAGKVLEKLKPFQPDLIVLAGFLLKFPHDIIAHYHGKIINIHPALLPKYGGKGMYGMNVHRAIIENKESETGITIHYIDEHYDEGDIIFQKSVALNGRETCEEISEKVQQLEHEYFPVIVEKIISEL
ncbi:MAG TPA: phosphoribosylglycinamide formyltransferase [Flavobacterium sp.]|nr:phosphoribosylglycinamide formyltransferase [Flavobacterium sp.]